MIHFFRCFAVFIYEFLISLKLAVILIVLLMISLAAGTILESLHGASTAKLMIYNAPFFTVLLILLGANVLTVAISRWPWQKKHIGFLLTHAGIILILAGSLITRYTMIDGQMVLREGEQSGVITLPDQQIEIQKAGSRKAWFYPVSQKPFPWEGHEKMGRPGELTVELSLLSYYPKAVARQTIQQASEGPAAVRIRLHNAMNNETFWLYEDDPVEGFRQMGPAVFSFSKEPLSQPQQDQKAELSLEIHAGEKQWTIPFSQDETVPFERPLEGSPYKIILEKWFKNAGVNGRTMIEQPLPSGAPEWRNPAVIVRVAGDGIEQTYNVFSNFPDFESIHGQQADEKKMKIVFHAPGQEISSAQHELHFFKRDEKLIYQVKTNNALVEYEASLEEDNLLGWMGFSFELEEYLPHARQITQYEPRSNTSTDEKAAAAIRIGLQEGQHKEDVWLMEGDSAHVHAGENVYRLTFGRKQRPLGFSLKLPDFKNVEWLDAEIRTEDNDGVDEAEFQPSELRAGPEGLNQPPVLRAIDEQVSDEEVIRYILRGTAFKQANVNLGWASEDEERSLESHQRQRVLIESRSPESAILRLHEKQELAELKSVDGASSARWQKLLFDPDFEGDEKIFLEAFGPAHQRAIRAEIEYINQLKELQPSELEARYLVLAHPLYVGEFVRRTALGAAAISERARVLFASEEIDSAQFETAIDYYRSLGLEYPEFAVAVLVSQLNELRISSQAGYADTGKSELRRMDLDTLLSQARDRSTEMPQRLKALSELEAYFTDRTYANVLPWQDLVHWADAEKLVPVLDELQNPLQDQVIRNAAVSVRQKIIAEMGRFLSLEELDSLPDDQARREIFYVANWHHLWNLPFTLDQMRPYAEILLREVSLRFAKTDSPFYGWFNGWEIKGLDDDADLENFLTGLALVDAFNREYALRLLRSYLASAGQETDDRIIGLLRKHLEDSWAFNIQRLTDAEVAEKKERWEEMPVEEKIGQAGISMVFDNLIGAGPYNFFHLLSEKYSQKRLELARDLASDAERDALEMQTHEHTAFDDKPFPHVHWDSVRRKKASEALSKLEKSELRTQSAGDDIPVIRSAEEAIKLMDSAIAQGAIQPVDARAVHAMALRDANYRGVHIRKFEKGKLNPVDDVLQSGSVRAQPSRPDTHWGALGQAFAYAADLIQSKISEPPPEIGIVFEILGEQARQHGLDGNQTIGQSGPIAISEMNRIWLLKTLPGKTVIDRIFYWQEVRFPAADEEISAELKSELRTEIRSLSLDEFAAVIEQLIKIEDESAGIRRQEDVTAFDPRIKLKEEIAILQSALSQVLGAEAENYELTRLLTRITERIGTAADSAEDPMTGVFRFLFDPAQGIERNGFQTAWIDILTFPEIILLSSVGGGDVSLPDLMPAVYEAHSDVLMLNSVRELLEVIKDRNRFMEIESLNTRALILTAFSGLSFGTIEFSAEGGESRQFSMDPAYEAPLSALAALEGIIPPAFIDFYAEAESQIDTFNDFIQAMTSEEAQRKVLGLMSQAIYRPGDLNADTVQKAREAVLQLFLMLGIAPLLSELPFSLPAEEQFVQINVSVRDSFIARLGDMAAIFQERGFYAELEFLSQIQEHLDSDSVDRSAVNGLFWELFSTGTDWQSEIDDQEQSLHDRVQGVWNDFQAASQKSELRQKAVSAKEYLSKIASDKVDSVLEQLVELDSLLFGTEERSAIPSWKSRLAAGSTKDVLLLFDASGAALQGFAFYESGENPHLYRIGVMPGAQREGLGSALMDMLMNETLERDAQRLTLSAAPESVDFFDKYLARHPDFSVQKDPPDELGYVDFTIQKSEMRAGVDQKIAESRRKTLQAKADMEYLEALYFDRVKAQTQGADWRRQLARQVEIAGLAVSNAHESWMNLERDFYLDYFQGEELETNIESLMVLFDRYRSIEEQVLAVVERYYIEDSGADMSRPADTGIPLEDLEPGDEKSELRTQEDRSQFEQLYSDVMEIPADQIDTKMKALFEKAEDLDYHLIIAGGAARRFALRHFLNGVEDPLLKEFLSRIELTDIDGQIKKNDANGDLVSLEQDEFAHWDQLSLQITGLRFERALIFDVEPQMSGLILEKTGDQYFLRGLTGVFDQIRDRRFQFYIPANYKHYHSDTPEVRELIDRFLKWIKLPRLMGFTVLFTQAGGFKLIDQATKDYLRGLFELVKFDERAEVADFLLRGIALRLKGHLASGTPEALNQEMLGFIDEVLKNILPDSLRTEWMQVLSERSELRTGRRWAGTKR